MEEKQAIWDRDLLNRQGEGKFLSEYLLKRYANTPNKAFVLNINAEWGFGKTYFLKNLSEELKSYKHPVIYFDAWQNDYSDQPLLAFISEMNTSLKPFLSQNKKGQELFKKALNTSKKLLIPIFVKKITGLTYDQLMGEFDGSTENIKNENETEDDSTKNEVESVLSKLAESALAEHETVRKSISTFKENMQKLLTNINTTSNQLPMFVFIDELDRCRPNYAIELLENIKHIFDIPGIVFVIATDSKQLSHSINAVYGQNFASERYLKRFFDQEYNLIKPDNYAFAYYLFELHGITKDEKLFSPLEQEVYKDKDLNVELFTLYASFFKLGLRDQEQVATVLSAIVLTWQTTDSIHLGYLLFLIMLKQHSNIEFYLYIETPNNKKGVFFRDKIDQLEFDSSRQYQSTVITNQNAFYNGTREIKHSSIVELINTYVSLLELSLEKLYEKRNSNNNLLYSKIIDKMVADAQKNNQTVPNLNLYPHFVLQAGQFS